MHDNKQEIKMSQQSDQTSNAFAIALLFYYQYARVKVNKDDLFKIYKKYHKKPQDLITDLQKKYQDVFTVPSVITYHELSRLIHKFSIPTPYLNEIYRDVSASKLPVYEEKCDVMNKDFDADEVFTKNMIFASRIDYNPCDNMTRATRLLPVQVLLSGEIDSAVKRIDKIVNPTEAYFARKLREQAVKEHPELFVKEKTGDGEDNRPLLTVLAEVASMKAPFLSEKGEEIMIHPPIARLKYYMDQKIRVRIITRRRNALRGSVEGYVLTMDKFWNVVLKDADEVYITNKQKGRVMKRGEFVCERNVLRRYEKHPYFVPEHLPLVMMRGDNIVMLMPLPLPPAPGLTPDNLPPPLTLPPSPAEIVHTVNEDH